MIWQNGSMGVPRRGLSEEEIAGRGQHNDIETIGNREAADLWQAENGHGRGGRLLFLGNTDQAWPGFCQAIHTLLGNWRLPIIEDTTGATGRKVESGGTI